MINKNGEELLLSLKQIISYTLCLTGTAWRWDNETIPFLDYENDSDERWVKPDFRYTMGEAIKHRVCRPIQFIPIDGDAEYQVDDKEYKIRISKAEDENLSKVFATIYSINSKWLKKVINLVYQKIEEFRKQGDLDAGALFVVPPGYTNDDNDERRIYQIADLIKKETGEIPVVVTSDDDESQRKIKDFKKGKEKFIVSVRMISEGSNIPRLRVGAYATNTTSSLFFSQYAGRFNRFESDLPDNQEHRVSSFTTPTISDFFFKISVSKNPQSPPECITRLTVSG